MKESNLFEPIKEWLEERGWEVFAEVSGYEGIADIVGRQRKMYCIVEMKTSLSHEVVDQAIRWVGHAHYIYIAIPKRKSAIPRYLEQLFREKGIGVLEVGKIDYSGLYNSEKYYINIKIPSKFKRAYNLTSRTWRLHEEQKYFVPAGSPGGAHWTPYKQTMKEVKEYLESRHYFSRRSKNKDKAWVSIDEILKHCETHYANPKPSLAKALKEFETDWCECKKMNRKLYFRFKEIKIS